MSQDAPTVLVLAGPNGAGKSTVAPFLVRDVFGITDFVNADDIARGLSGFSPEAVAIAAGRIMLRRIDELTAEGKSFAFETTLASRSFAPRLAAMQRLGYAVRLVFLGLPSAELAVERVRRRVREGGHDVPVNTIERRLQRGVRNFLTLYRPIVNHWWIYDSFGLHLVKVAEGFFDGEPTVYDAARWERFVDLGNEPFRPDSRPEL